MGIKPLKVSEVNNYIKRVVLNDLILSNINIEGEISNFKHHYSGHMYFSLKDDKSKIRCVMFKGDNANLNINLEDGMKIIATGYISIYEKDGDYQLYIKNIKKSGVGDLYKAFEELKRKLEMEGLFLESNKKSIPSIPRKIGVVTSSTGAAIRDIITTINRRFPLCKILLYPSLVQGSQAPKSICEGIKYLENRKDVDLIIIGRGGGSIEELFAFNDEHLARTIFSLETPIISAVGHETDFTIADFVADLRAATPTAAAELSVPELKGLFYNLENNYNRLLNIYDKWKKSNSMDLKYLNTNLNSLNPINRVKDRRQEIDSLFKELIYKIEKKFNNETNKMTSLKNSLDFFDPTLSLDRGYGILLDRYENIIKSISDVSIDEEFNILIKDGMIKVKVVNIQEEGKFDGIK